MRDNRYTIRLRYGNRRGQRAVIVEDACGDAYIFDPHGFRCRLHGAHDLRTLAPTLHRLGWLAVPAVAPYSLSGLRRLLQANAA